MRALIAHWPDIIGDLAIAAGASLFAAALGGAAALAWAL